MRSFVRLAGVVLGVLREATKGEDLEQEFCWFANLEREFYKLLKRAGLPKIIFHGLRHTCASLMLLSNTAAKVVLEMLGHADVAFTLKVYSHILHGMQRSAADDMDEMLF